MENAKQPYDKIIQKIIGNTDCSYQVFSQDFTVEEVNAIYESEWKEGKQKGFVPVLLVLDDTLQEWFGFLEGDSYSREEIIKQNLDGAEILKDRYKEYMQDHEEYEMSVSEFEGEKTGGEVIDYLSSFEKYSGDGIEKTILFRVPVKNPWEVIAWFPMGGWNECPPAEEMMAVCKKWYEAYGAVPAVISHDTLEFVVEKPVEDEQEAWALAREHYAFCPDRVDQCTESYTLGEVADCLSKSTVWFFWWD